jgi:hypothetical protein
MMPVGYMAKRDSVRPDWLKAPKVRDIYSVSNCDSEDSIMKPMKLNSGQFGHENAGEGARATRSFSHHQLGNGL